MHAFMYQPGESAIHRLSPACKIIALICAFVTVMSAQTLEILGLGLALICGGILFSGIQSLVWRIFPVLCILFLFPLLLWSFYFRGPTAIPVCMGLQMTCEGLRFGALMGLKFDLMVLCGLLLLGTTKIEEFTSGLTYLGAPYRMSFSLALAFRLVPVFFNAFDVITQAQNSRGLVTGKGGLFKRMRDTVPLLIPVFVSALRQTDQMAIALESKGFGFSVHRTSLNPVRMKLTDWLASLASVAIALGSLIMRWL
jgi:energy-coupling factor transport system permease protein